MNIPRSRAVYIQDDGDWDCETPAVISEDVLTPREFEVVRLAVRGFSNKEIARTLDISHHTVSTHIRQIFCKLGLKRRVQLAAYLANRAGDRRTSMWGSK